MPYKKNIFNEYAEKVAEAHSISLKTLFTKDKSHQISGARHMLYYLCKKRPMQIASIETYMKENGYNITHSSIIHGLNSVATNKLNDKDFMAMCSKIEECVTA